MLQDHCTQDDDDNRIVADSIAKHLPPPPHHLRTLRYPDPLALYAN